MAASVSRALMNTHQVVNLLDHDDEDAADSELDD